VRGVRPTKYKKNSWVNFFVILLSNFFNFRTLTPNFSKKCQGTFFEIVGVFDQVEGVEHEYGQKAWSGFRRHFGKKSKIGCIACITLMWPIATDVAHSVTASVWMLGIQANPAKTDGWTDAIWGTDSHGSKKPLIRWGGAYWHHLANTIERCVPGDAALCQIA